MIKVDNISFSYNEQEVIKNVSFEIHESDFIALIGANGSGKSTLVKLILGILKPKSGEIIFDREVRFGYVPQKFNIDYNFPIRVDEIIRKNYSDVVKLLGIKDIMKKQFSKLSGGQQQKVMIALALLDNPDILILDEPAVGIDSVSLNNFYSLLNKLNKSGKTIIIVSHDVSVISKKVKSVICMSDKCCKFGKSNQAEKLIKSVYGKNFGVHKHV